MPYGGIAVDYFQNSNGQTISTQPPAFRNRIINGDMRIDQRNVGASGSPTTGYTLDRWEAAATQSSKFTLQRNAGSVTPPLGFTNYLGITSSSAYSVTSTDLFRISTTLEGLDIADFAWGTANAKTIAVSFWVRSSLTGLFGGAIQNAANSRAYPFTYNINSANTWEWKTIIIPGETSGAWNSDINLGLRIQWGLGLGSTKVTTAGAWANGDYNGATGTVSVVGTNAATWYITGVQLEVGTVSTSFDFRDYGRELIMCQRYYQKSYEPGTVPGSSVNNEYAIQQDWGSAAGGIASSVFPLAVTMRTNPTLTIYDIVGNSGKITGLDSGANQTQNVSYNNTNATVTRVYVRMYAVSYYGISYMFTATAEL